jgi:hypothetical protein
MNGYTLKNHEPQMLRPDSEGPMFSKSPDSSSDEAMFVSIMDHLQIIFSTGIITILVDYSVLHVG